MTEHVPVCGEWDGVSRAEALRRLLERAEREATVSWWRRVVRWVAWWM